MEEPSTQTVPGAVGLMFLQQNTDVSSCLVTAEIGALLTPMTPPQIPCTGRLTW